MNAIELFWREYQTLILTVLSAGVLTFLAWKMWEKISFWFYRIHCKLPLVGKIAQLTKNQAYNADTGWFSSERELCAGFYPYYQSYDFNPDFFNDCTSYLRKVQETGRKNLPLLGWFLIAIMVFIEAMGFSYVLAGWTVPGASEALKEQAAFGIAVLISIILVMLTHKTGHELHKNTLIKKVTAWFNMSGEPGTSKKVPNTQVDLANEHIDDNDPQWRQLLSRINANHNVTAKYPITAITVIFIVAVAVFSTYVRGQVLEKMIVEENLHPQTGLYDDNAFDAVDPYAEQENTLPAELVASQQEADENAKKSGIEADRKGGWGTFIILAVIFIFLQIVGVILGYSWGFAGKESAKAREYIGRFRTAEEFDIFHKRKRDYVAQIAQKYLEILQSRMVDHAETNHIDRTAIDHLRDTTGRTFYAYVRQMRSDRDLHLQEQNEKSPRKDDASPSDDIALSEEEIEKWMTKLNWDREKTIALLKEHKEKAQKAEKQVSKEEALAMLSAESGGKVLSDAEALELLEREAEGAKA